MINIDDITTHLHKGFSRDLEDQWKHTKIEAEQILLEPLHGYYIIHSKGQSIEVAPGTAILIPSHCKATFEHCFGVENYMSARWLHFSIKHHGLRTKN